MLMKRSLLVLVLAGLLLLSQSNILLSNASEDEVDEEFVATDNICEQVMIEQGEIFITAYQDFLTGYFKQDEPSSDLLEEALEYYRFVEAALIGIFNTQFDTGREGYQDDFESTFDEVSNCARVRDEYISFAGLLLQAQMLQSGTSKRTYKIIDGLKALNENLSDFSVDFNATFPRMFTKMDNALPCYAKECIVK